MSSLKSYQWLRGQIGDSGQLKSNVLILSVPGMGAGYLIKKYIEEYPEIKYVNGPNQLLGERLTAMYLAYDIDETALKWADDYIRASGINQSFLIFLNSPGLIDTEKFKQSYLAGHIYKTVFLKVADREDIAAIAQSYKPGISEKLIEKIGELSGGLAQVVKYLSLNTGWLDKRTEDILADVNLGKIIEPTARMISYCSSDILGEMELTQSDVLKSTLVQLMLEKMGGRKEKINITINFDLSLEEGGEKTGESVTHREKQILEEMIVGGGSITKEKVSDVKWGEGKYDEYSDQAINKTMRRLNTKLKTYMIETIPKIGYRIVKK